MPISRRRLQAWERAGLANVTARTSSQPASLDPGSSIPLISDTRLLVGDGVDILAHRGAISFSPTPSPKKEDGLRAQGELAIQLDNIVAFRIAALKALKHASNQVRSGTQIMAFASSPKGRETTAGGSSGRAVVTTDPVAQLTLALLVPLLESQSRTDSSLIPSTVNALLLFLKSLSPDALKSAPQAALKGLERVLRSWLQMGPEQLAAAGVPIEDVASGLTVFTLARDNVEAYLELLCELLSNLDPDAELPVGDYLRSFAQSKLRLVPPMLIQSSAWPLVAGGRDSHEGRRQFHHPQHPHPLVRTLRNQGWHCDGGCGYKSSRNSFRPRYRCRDGCDYDLCAQCMGDTVNAAYSLAAADGYLYILSNEGCSITQVGTGYHGTVEGHIYHQRTGVEPGTIATADGCLLHFANKRVIKGALAEVLSCSTLQPVGLLLPPPDAQANLRHHQRRQLHIWSDGHYFFRMRYRDHNESLVDVVVEQFALPTELPWQQANPPVAEATVQAHALRAAVSPWTNDQGETCLVVADLTASATECLAGTLCTGDVVLSAQGTPVNSLEDFDAILVRLVAQESEDASGQSATAPAQASEGGQHSETSEAMLSISFQRRGSTCILERMKVLRPSTSSESASSTNSQDGDHSNEPSGFKLGSTAVGHDDSANGEEAAGKTTCGLSKSLLRNCCVTAIGDAVLLLNVSSAPGSWAAYGGRSSEAAGLIEHYAFDLNTGRAVSPQSYISTATSNSIFEGEGGLSVALTTDPQHQCLWGYNGTTVEAFSWTDSPLSQQPLGAALRLSADLGAGEACSRSAVVHLLARLVNQAAARSSSVSFRAVETMLTSGAEQLSQATKPSTQLELASARQVLCAFGEVFAALKDDPNQKNRGSLDELLQSLYHVLTRCRALAKSADSSLASDLSTLTGYLEEWAFNDGTDSGETHTRIAAANSLAHGLGLLYDGLDAQRALFFRALDTAATSPRVMKPLFTELIVNCDLQTESGREQLLAFVGPVVAAAEHRLTERVRDAVQAVLTHNLSDSNNSSSAQPSMDGPERADQPTLVLARMCGRLFSQTSEDDALVAQRRVASQLLAATSRILRLLQELLAESLSDERRNSTLTGVLNALFTASLLGRCVPYVLYSSRRVWADLELQKEAEASASLLAELSPVLVPRQQRKPIRSQLAQPWQAGILLETPHPIYDDFRFRRTVTSAGASCLYLIFDPRCATQYDYDKVSIYAGASDSAPLVAEFGGNTHGFGSGVLGAGWPRQPVQVPGDTVTFVLDVRSARESATPDAAMFGLAVEIKRGGHESSAHFTPCFALDLHLVMLNRLTQAMADMDGADEFEPHALESTVTRLFEDAGMLSAFYLQGLALPANLRAHSPEEQARALGNLLDTGAALTLEPDALAVLREVVKTKAVPMSPRLAAMLRPDVFEGLMLTLVTQHIGAFEEVEAFAQKERDTLNPWLTKLVRETLRKTDALFRKLVGLANLERQWTQALEEFVDDPSLGVADQGVFFSTWHADETRLPSLRSLCMLFIPAEPQSDAADMVRALTQEFERLVDYHRSSGAVVSFEQEPIRQIGNALLSRAKLLIKLQLLEPPEGENWERGSPVGRTSSGVGAGTDRSLSRTLSHEGRPGVSRQGSAPPLLQRLTSRPSDASSLATVSDTNQTSPPSGTETDLVDSVIAGFFHFVSDGAFCQHPISGPDVCLIMASQGERALAHVVKLERLCALVKIVQQPATPAVAIRYVIEAVKDFLLQHHEALRLALSGKLDRICAELSTLLSALVALAKHDPDYHVGVLACLFLPVRPRDALLLRSSGLTALLEVMCEEPLYFRETDVADNLLSALQALADQCLDWETSVSGNPGDGRQQAPFVNELSSVLGGQLAACVVQLEATADADANVDTARLLSLTLDILHLLDYIAGSRFGQGILARGPIMLGLLRLLTLPMVVPRIIQVLLRLLAVALPACQLGSAESEALAVMLRDISHGSVAANATEAICKVILHRIGNLMRNVVHAPLGENPVPVSDTATTPSTPQPVSSRDEGSARVTAPVAADPHASAPMEQTPPARPRYLPFADGSASSAGEPGQRIHEHGLRLTHNPYSNESASWQCDLCASVGSNEVYHCPSCHFDVCPDCVLSLLDRPGMPESAPASPSGASAGTAGLMKAKPPGQFVVRLHRRPDQSPRDIIHPLLRSGSRLSGRDGEPIENIMRIDRELASNASIVIQQGLYDDCVRRAVELAGMGMVASVERQDMAAGHASAVANASRRPQHRQGPSSDMRQSQMRNEKLKQSRTGRRSFLSAAAAGECIHQVILLVHSIVSQENGPASRWTRALEGVLEAVVKHIPTLVPTLAGAERLPREDDLDQAALALGALAILGGFREEVHAGADVLVSKPGLMPIIGTVDVLDPNRNEAVVFLNGVAEKVPLSCLQSQFEDPPHHLLRLFPATFFGALQGLLQQGYGQPLGVQCSSTETSKVLEGHRLLAEMRTRACLVLSARMKDRGMAQAFMAQGGPALDIVVKLAREAQRMAGEPVHTLQSTGARLRAAFFEKSKPAPRNKSAGGDEHTVSSLRWVPTQQFPPMHGVVFCSNNLGMRSLGLALMDRREAMTHRTVTALASHNIPASCEWFYFEVRLVAYMDGLDFALGLTPRMNESNGGSDDLRWPAGSVLLHESGQVKYQRSSESSEDHSEQLRLRAGDVLGCFWQADSGTLQFTHNGRLLEGKLQGIPRSSFPVVRMGRGRMEVLANFGSSPFVFDAARHYRTQSHATSSQDDAEDPSNLFSFSMFAETEEDVQVPASKHRVPEVEAVIDADDWKGSGDQPYALVQANSSMTGQTALGVGEEEVEEEDMTAKLIKAWETQVFPQISSRFRNSQERTSGLQQIRGALEMGMEDIARMTIETLYEENGGVPDSIHFPSSEELREQGSRLAAGKIKPGMRVRILEVNDRHDAEGTLAEVAATEWQIGTVVTVDESANLALVDVYLAMDAQLIQWWYPFNMLEEMDHRAAPTADAHAQGELLVIESKLTRLTCREAVLHLHNHDEARNTTLVSHLDLLRLLLLSHIRPSLPGACILQHHVAEAMFDPDAREALQDQVHALLQRCSSNAALNQLVTDACGPLLQPAGLYKRCNMPVEVGRRQYDVAFDRGAAVVVQARAWKGGAVRAMGPSAQDGPWARFYVGSMGTGPRYAVYPTQAASMRSPVPALLFSSKTLHVRTTAQDEHPNALLEASVVPEDWPVALMLIQHHLARASAAMSGLHLASGLRLRLLEACAKLGSQPDMTPTLRETLLHTAAQLLRASHSTLKESGGPSADLRAAFDRIWRACSALHAEPQPTLQACQFSTLFMALLEAAAAFQEVCGYQTFATGTGGDSDAEHSSLTSAASTTDPSPAPFEPSLAFGGDGLDLELPSDAAASVLAALRAPSEDPAQGDSEHDNDDSADRVAAQADAMGAPMVPRLARIDFSMPRRRGRRQLAARGRRVAAPVRFGGSDVAVTPRNEKEAPAWFRSVVDTGLLCEHLALSQATDATDAADAAFRAALRCAHKQTQRCDPLRRMLVLADVRLNLTRLECQRHLAAALGTSHGYRVIHSNTDAADDATATVTDGVLLLELEDESHALVWIRQLKEDVRLGTNGRCAIGLVCANGDPAEGEGDEDEADHEQDPNVAAPSQRIAIGQGPATASIEWYVAPRESTNASIQSHVCGHVASKFADDSGLRSELQTCLKEILAPGVTSVAADAGSKEDAPVVAIKVDEVLRAVPWPLVDSLVQPAHRLRHLLNHIEPNSEHVATALNMHAENGVLTLDGLFNYVFLELQDGPMRVARAVIRCGFDLDFRPLYEVQWFRALESTLQTPWTPRADEQVIRLGDSLAARLHVSARDLALQDIKLTAVARTDRAYADLSCFTDAQIRLRFALLRILNTRLAKSLPLIDLRQPCLPGSLCARVSGARHALFYATQQQFAQALVNDTSERVDPKGPELVLDALEGVNFAAGTGGPTDEDATPSAARGTTLQQVDANDGVSEAAAGDEVAGPMIPNEEGNEALADPAAAPTFHGPGGRQTHHGASTQGGGVTDSIVGRAKYAETQFWQAAGQVAAMEPGLMRVKKAAGGDPIYPLLIKFTGERVAGNSGSFREFMQRMANDLHGAQLSLLIKAPAGAYGRNKGKWIINPARFDFAVYKQYEFLGTLFALAIRSDVPLPLDILPSFWKCLAGCPLSSSDLADCDFLLDTRLQELKRLGDEDEFDEYVLQHGLTYSMHTLLGEERAVPRPAGASDGPHALLRFADRHAYIKAATHQRLLELSNPPAFEAMRKGFRSILPLELLAGLERMVCGYPHIDLAYLRQHTTYASGLTPNDAHVEAFWAVLAEFSQEELRKFVKFAANQERLPADSGTDVHQPPLPMKIAQPDPDESQANADQRWIRAETCMFMLKLPRYSSKDILRTRLLQAMATRDDPLVG